MAIETNTKERKVFVGQGASPGYVIAKAKFLTRQNAKVSKYEIKKTDVEKQIKFFHKRLNQAKEEIINLRDITFNETSASESKIFESHLLILQDPFLIESVINLIKNKLWNAGYAFHFCMQNLIEKFENNSGIFKERVQDLKDIYNRLIIYLNNEDDKVKYEKIEEFEYNSNEPIIIIGYSILPGTLMKLNKEKVIGIAMDTGSVTSHVSILVRSMQIPSVIGISNLSKSVKEEDLVLLDGTSGMVIINPDSMDLSRFENKIKVFQTQKIELFTMRDLEPLTMDGKHIKLTANIGNFEEAKEIRSFGAMGIGLYRSEFLFFGRKTLPSEQEQLEAYRSVTHLLSSMPVTIRTLDIGGDKAVGSINIGKEDNPFMGWRSIRICLDRKDIFTEQLRAIIKSGDKGNVKIMFPMISNLSELENAKAIYNKCCTELENEGFIIPNIEIGVMIEVPSAVMIIEEIVKKVDFISIGTNDLIQFTLAVDRTNAKIVSMYDPHHPAVLKYIKHVVDVAHEGGISVSVCGEMASDPLSTLLLIGFGVDELSMAAWSVMECKKIIRSVNYDEVRCISNEALKLPNSNSINNFLKEKYSKRIKNLDISSFISSSVQDFSSQDRALIRNVDGDIEKLEKF